MEIEVPYCLVGPLLHFAAVTEMCLEEIVEEAIKKQLEGSDRYG